MGTRGFRSGRKSKGQVASSTPFHSAHVVVPDGFTPFRDRSIPTKGSVACPSCGAAVGESCRNVHGMEILTCHPVRRRMAIRLLNQAREAAETREA